MQKVLMILVALFVVEEVFSASPHRIKKSEGTSISTSTTTEQLELCDSSPCGWAIYFRPTRELDYFMKNRCQCKPGEFCRKGEHNLSLSAYIYRCKPKDPPTSTIVPTIEPAQS